MSIPSELLDTLRKLGALDQRTADVADYVKRVEGKIDTIIDRLSRLEVEVKYLRDNVKNEVMADIKAEIVRVQSDLNYQKRLMSMQIDGERLPASSSDSK